MSGFGSLIGAVGGAIIGSFFGVPQIGFVIGGMIGGVADAFTAPKVKGPAKETLSLTLNEIGSPIPDLLGTGKITGMFLCYGKERTKKIKQKSGGKGMGGGSQTTGYKYYMSWVQALCAGPVDTLYAIYCDNDTLLWSGELNCPVSGGMETIASEDFGTINFYFGTNDHAQNTKIGEIIGDPSLNSPLRGLCYAFMDDCYIGTSNRCPSLHFVIRKAPAIAELPDGTIQTYNYNPANALWYILNKLLKLPATWLDETDFTAVSETLATENRGISLPVDSYQEGLNYIQAITAHSGMVSPYGSDGKFHPKLIRDDYSIPTLPLVDEDVYVEEPTISRPGWIDTINEVKVTYSEIYENEDAINIRQSTANPVATDIGNRVIQERVVTKEVSFPLFTRNANAVWAGRELLLRSSYPLAQISFPANRNAFRLEVGDVFLFSNEHYGISNMICRVVHISGDDPESEIITFTTTEDVYSLSNPITEYTVPDDNTQSSPDYTTIPVVSQTIIEAYPGLFLSNNVTLIPLAARESQIDLGYLVYMSIDGGTSYFFLKEANFVPFGNLVGTYPVTALEDHGDGFTIDFANSDVDSIQTITWEEALAGQMNVAMLGTEIISFQTITPISGTQYQITDVIRARYGTTQVEHTEGANFFYISEGTATLNHPEIRPGVTRYFKYVPYNAEAEGDISDATPLSIAITALPAVTALTTSGQVYTIKVSLTYSRNVYFDLVEIWSSLTNDRSEAEYSGFTRANTFAHTGRGLVETRYYWARVKDIYGNYSDWYPASATGGVSGTTSTEPTDYLTILNGSITESQLYQDLVDQLDEIDSIENEYTIKLNASGHIVGFGMMVDAVSSDFIIVADKFAVVKPGATPGTPSVMFTVGNIDGNSAVGINGDLIIDGSILARNIGANEVIANAANIKDALITGAKISEATIGTLHLEDNSVSNDVVYSNANNESINSWTYGTYYNVASLDYIIDSDQEEYALAFFGQILSDISIAINYTYYNYSIGLVYRWRVYNVTTEQTLYTFTDNIGSLCALASNGSVVSCSWKDSGGNFIHSLQSGWSAGDTIRLYLDAARVNASVPSAAATGNITLRSLHIMGLKK